MCHISTQNKWGLRPSPGPSSWAVSAWVHTLQVGKQTDPGYGGGACGACFQDNAQGQNQQLKLQSLTSPCPCLPSSGPFEQETRLTGSKPHVSMALPSRAPTTRARRPSQEAWASLPSPRTGLGTPGPPRLPPAQPARRAWPHLDLLAQKAHRGTQPLRATVLGVGLTSEAPPGGRVQPGQH